MRTSNALPAPKKWRGGGPSRPLSERFEEKVDRSGGPDACHIWNAARRPFGYGAISGPRSMLVAHRVAWELANGPVPRGLCVCHRCDNPPCVNPAHLFLGTLVDNMTDRTRKGRVPMGEEHGRAILTAADVRRVRRLLSAGELSQRDIGRRYGVSADAIGAIKRGISWRGKRRSVPTKGKR